MIQECIGKRKYCRTGSAAIKVGDFIFVSGQIPDEKALTGSIEEQTASCIDKIESILEESGLALHYVLKMQIFLTDIKTFDRVQRVLEERFREMMPACTAIGVAALLEDAKIMIDANAMDMRVLEALCEEDKCTCDGNVCTCCEDD